MRSVVASGLLLLAAGCSGVDNRPYSWGYISGAIFQPSCATPSCHSRAVAVAGLDFSDPDRGYASLTAGSVLITNPQGTFDGGCITPDAGSTDAGAICFAARPLVIPYNPSQSRLVNMLRARDAPRMPPDRPLTEPDIRLIENWILDGARKISTPPAGSSSGAPSDGGSRRDAAGDHPSSPSDSGADANTDGSAASGTDAGADASSVRDGGGQ
jgi:hypothetical protein